MTQQTEQSTPKPRRDAVARLSLKLPVHLRRRIERQAKREKRTLMAQAQLLIERGLASSQEEITTV